MAVINTSTTAVYTVTGCIFHHKVSMINTYYQNSLSFDNQPIPLPEKDTLSDCINYFCMMQ